MFRLFRLNGHTGTHTLDPLKQAIHLGHTIGQSSAQRTHAALVCVSQALIAAVAGNLRGRNKPEGLILKMMHSTHFATPYTHRPSRDLTDASSWYTATTSCENFPTSGLLLTEAGFLATLYCYSTFSCFLRSVLLMVVLVPTSLSDLVNACVQHWFCCSRCIG